MKQVLKNCKTNIKHLNILFYITCNNYINKIIILTKIMCFMSYFKFI